MPKFFSCENIVIWRGHFTGSGEEKSVNLSINGGEGTYNSLAFQLSSYVVFAAFAATVWLNDVFLNTSYGK